MLFLRNACPVSYDLCKQTVTVYHNEGGQITRKVYEKAFFEQKKTQSVDKTGSREANSFLLVIPGDAQTVFVGDKVLEGVGPEISTTSELAALIPTTTPGVCVVKYADPKSWGSKIVHTEAGG